MTLNKSLTIDVVICTYNNATLLDQALIAISMQQVPPHVEWKVLVVDNNCTDETPIVIGKHIASGKIPYLYKVFEPKQGLTHARLCRVENTNGDWIAFVDDDCFLREDWIAQAAKFALKYPRCGALGERVILDWEVPPPTFLLKYGYSYAFQGHGKASREVSCLVGAGLIIKRSALLECGWMQKQFLSDRTANKLISGGDVEIALRIRGAGYQLWYNPECQLRHFIPSQCISKIYLVRINYGLGTCQFYGDSMIWSGSYLKWLSVSIFDTLRATSGVLIQTLRALRRKKSMIEVAINWSFVRGKWAGIWKMFRISSEKRRALLGCAKLN
ncbi:MAG: glycosyltransferase [Deltaproteobacteria bacterium]|jgi:glycosyltransferase involved in cell wall biosynthesis|nr:glycosyltransferase [Deltaproteobacteria bacterium]